MDPHLRNEPSKLTASLSRAGGSTFLVLNFRRLLVAHELDYRVESSPDLQTWSPVTGQEAEPELNADGTITVSVNAGLFAHSSARFYRLRVARK
jgi:hypothetical protein